MLTLGLWINPNYEQVLWTAIRKKETIKRADGQALKIWRAAAKE